MALLYAAAYGYLPIIKGTGTQTITETETLIRTTTITETAGAQSYTVTLTYTRTSTKTVVFTQTETRTITVTAQPRSRVIGVDLRWSDERPIFGSPKIVITGYLVNVGAETAYNVVLHVTYYQGNVRTTKDIIIGNIQPYDWKKVDEEIYYEGGPIDRLTIDIDWS